MNFTSDLSSLDIETQRKIGAFVGAIVGDAASLHLEWIYDQNKVIHNKKFLINLSKKK